jgi:hypothetical protein
MCKTVYNLNACNPPSLSNASAQPRYTHAQTTHSVAHTAAAARPLAGRALLLTGSSGSSTSSTSSSTSTSSGSGFNWRRALRQVTDSFTTQGGNPYNNPLQIYAHAHEVCAARF